MRSKPIRQNRTERKLLLSRHLDGEVKKKEKVCSLELQAYPYEHMWPTELEKTAISEFNLK